MKKNEMMSAEDTCKKIAKLMRSGNGQAALDIIAQRDRAILEAAAERVDNLVIDVQLDLSTIEQSKEAILAQLSEAGK